MKLTPVRILRYFQQTLLAFITLVGAGQTLADAMVWEATNKYGKVYLGGTFHMLKITDYPLKSEYEVAYQAADTLYFETDLYKMQSPEGQQLMMQAMSQPKGQSLKTELSAKSYALLSQAAASVGVDIAQFQQFKAAMVVISLVSIELSKMGVTPTSGVEMYFSHKAKTDNKKTYGLETLEEHLKVLANMGMGNEDEMVEQSVNELKELSSEFNKLVKAWKDADLNTLEHQFIAEMKAYPELYDSLLVKRNKDWVQSIEQLVKSPEVEYILVGAAHLVGEDSVLEMLKQKGYDIKRVPATKAKTPSQNKLSQ